MSADLNADLSPNTNTDTDTSTNTSTEDPMTEMMMLPRSTALARPEGVWCASLDLLLVHYPHGAEQGTIMGETTGDTREGRLMAAAWVRDDACESYVACAECHRAVPVLQTHDAQDDGWQGDAEMFFTDGACGVIVLEMRAA